MIVLEDATAEASAERAADLIAEHLRAAIAERGTATLAASGGRSPLPLLAALATRALDWAAVEVHQVDERVVAAGDADRNAAMIRVALVEPTGAQDCCWSFDHTLGLDALGVRAAELSSALEASPGAPPAFDVVHLGLGADGHTASWPPADPITEVDDQWVALVGPFNGQHRFTLTVPVVNAARAVVWFVPGNDKASVLDQLLARDQTIPASRVQAPVQMLYRQPG